MESRRDVFGLADEAIDSDYLHFLYQGGELLSSGELNGARDALEKAYRLKPKHQKTLSLLALTYFKLGTYDRALDLYRQLCEENPSDPTLRVNIGLVFLKTGQVEEAIQELNAAIDLQPDHAKALNYLGLAWAQKGELLQAREFFVKAKNEAMALKMDRQIAEASGGAPPAAPEAEEPPPEVPPPTPADTALAVAEPSPSTTAPMRAVAPPPAAPVHAAPIELAAFSAAVNLEPPPGTPYSLSGPVLAVDVAGEIFTRLDGLLSLRGELTLTPEMKRFRGKATDKAFGERERRMVRASGQGRLLIARGERLFTALDLGEEACYFREDAVFSFQERISFENGRVPSRVSPDLHLIHLRGAGSFLLATLGPIAALEVPKGVPARVPLHSLIGWHGNLAPKILVVAEEAGADGGPLVAVDLSGEGRVLVELPPPELGRNT